MNRRCQHQGNVVVYEAVASEIVFVFYRGGLLEDFAGKSSPTGEVVVRCKDCGHSVRARDGERLPKWAKTLWQKVNEGGRS